MFDITFLIQLLGIVLVLATILAQTALWQRKEYRLDRMRAHINESGWLGSTGKVFIIFLVLVNLGWLAFLADWVLGAVLFSVASLLWLGLELTRQLRQRGLARPDFTAKAILIISLAVIIELVYFYFTFNVLYFVSLQLANAILVASVAVAGGVTVANLMANRRKQYIYSAAAAVRKNNTKTTFVGITGSYGKTSLKNFADQLLTSASVPHAATAEHKNDLLPVAYDMLDHLNADLAVYIAEFGAYRRGEIGRLARLVQPSVGVITAISNQHVALFGSLPALIQGKWELIESLPEHGTAVLNADDENLRKKAQAFTGKIIWYSTKQKADVFVSSIDIQPKSIQAQLHINGERQVISTNLLGQGALSSVVGAAALVHALGVPAADIFTGIATLRGMPATMELRQGKQQSEIIDDSYSASEASVIDAVSHLQRFKASRKIILLATLIELGQSAEEVHQRLARYIAQTGNVVLIFGQIYTAIFEREFAAAGVSKNLFVSSVPHQAKDILLKLMRPKCVLLVEGRVPAILRDSVLVD